MSFILDALRKSDAERQRSAPPSLADVRYGGRRRRRDVWIPVLVVVLAINGLILGIRWLKPAAPPLPTAATPAAAVPAPAPASGVVAPAYPEVRPLAQEADALLEPDGDSAIPEPQVVAEVPENPVPPPASTMAPPASTMAPPAAVPPSSLQAPVQAPTQRLAQNPAQNAAAASPPGNSRILPADDLPTANELLASGRLGTTPLNLDLHVYSDSTASRFVVINSRKYKEGARLEEGPAVEAITPDGVILEHQGSRFILPRK